MPILQTSTERTDRAFLWGSSPRSLSTTAEQRTLALRAQQRTEKHDQHRGLVVTKCSPMPRKMREASTPPKLVARPIPATAMLHSSKPRRPHATGQTNGSGEPEMELTARQHVAPVELVRDAALQAPASQQTRMRTNLQASSDHAPRRARRARRAPQSPGRRGCRTQSHRSRRQPAQ